MFNKKIHQTRAFTLIDILVSVSIISFLSSIVMFNVSEGRTKAEDAQMKVESASVATAIELFKADNGGRTPISVREAEIQQNYGINTDTGEMYQEGTPEYEAVMNELVTGGYISEIPTSPDGESYAYGESTDGMQAMFVAQLSSESNISGNTQNSCEDIVTEPTTVEEPPAVEKCLQDRIPIIMPAPFTAYCKYIPPQFSIEDLQGDTYRATLTSPSGWDCSTIPYLNDPNMNCWEWSPGTLEEQCTSPGYIWEVDDSVSSTDICIEPDQSKGYMCVGNYTSPLPCESAPPIEGYTCTNIDAEIYQLCPTDQGGGGDTGGSGNLCSGENTEDYCTCI